MVSTIPLLSPIAAVYFFKERLSPMNIAGILISVVGVVLVILKDDFSFAASPKGVLLLLLAVVAAIAYSVVIIKLSGRYNVYSIITYQNLIGVFYFLPIFLFFDLDKLTSKMFEMDTVIPLIELSIFASSIAFMLFTYGINVLGIVKANAFTNAIPVVTAIFAYFILGETLSIMNISGIFIVMLGLFFSQAKLRKTIYKGS